MKRREQAENIRRTLAERQSQSSYLRQRLADTKNIAAQLQQQMTRAEDVSALIGNLLTETAAAVSLREQRQAGARAELDSMAEHVRRRLVRNIV